MRTGPPRHGTAALQHPGRLKVDIAQRVALCIGGESPVLAASVSDKQKARARLCCVKIYEHVGTTVGIASTCEHDGQFLTRPHGVSNISTKVFRKEGRRKTHAASLYLHCMPRCIVHSASHRLGIFFDSRGGRSKLLCLFPSIHPR